VTLTFSAHHDALLSSSNSPPIGSALMNNANRNHSRNTLVASLSFHLFHSGMASQKTRRSLSACGYCSPKPLGDHFRKSLSTSGSTLAYGALAQNSQSMMAIISVGFVAETMTLCRPISELTRTIGICSTTTGMLRMPVSMKSVIGPRYRDL
jgi:hypothetical protein